MKSRAGVEGCLSPPSKGELGLPGLKLLDQSENDILLLILLDSDHVKMGNLCGISFSALGSSMSNTAGGLAAPSLQAVELLHIRFPVGAYT